MRRSIATITALLAVLSSCGGDTTGATQGEDTGEDVVDTTTSIVSEQGATATTAPAGTQSEGHGVACAITMTGDVEDVVIFQQFPSAFVSDCWATEEELRQQVDFIGEEIMEGTYEEIVARGDPVLG